VLPQPNLVPANTYYAKKVISPLTMGVEKFMHAPTIVSFFMVIHSKVWTNVLSVGPVNTRKMTFTVVKKPPRGTRGIRRLQKRRYKNLNH